MYTLDYEKQQAKIIMINVLRQFICRIFQLFIYKQTLIYSDRFCLLEKLFEQNLWENYLQTSGASFVFKKFPSDLSND